MAADDFYDALPIAPLTPEELGLSPAPIAPQAPVLGPSPKDKRNNLIGSLAQLAAALGAGPGPVGRGVSQGFLQGQQQQQVTQQRADQQAQINYRQQQTDYEQAQRAHQAQQAQRDAAYQRNVLALRAAVAKAPTKAEADRYYETFAAGLQRSGFRVTANSLRPVAPYVAPKAADRALELFERWLKKGVNQDRWENHRADALKDILPFDYDGDGIDETQGATIERLAVLAGVVSTDPETGQVVTAPPGQVATMKANADGILSQLVAKAKAEGKAITPELMVTLQQEAIKLADEAKPEDPYLTEMRRMRTEEMRRRQNIPGELSPAQFNMANKLADDFARDSKDFIARAQSYDTVRAAAKDPSAAGDLSLIFAFMKMLDPGSVVREGEFATAQNTAGVPDRVRNVYNRLISGERLTPAQRADFIQQASNVYGQSKSRQDRIVSTYRSRAARAQVPQELVIMDYGATDEAAETAAPDAATSARDKLNQRR